MGRLLTKTIGIVFLCIIVLLCACTAKNNAAISTSSGANGGSQTANAVLADGQHTVFNGSIEGKNIEIDIYRSNNILTASYVARDSDAETALSGKIDGNTITLNQMVNGKSTASLDGTASANNIKGTYNNLVDGTQSAFVFTFDHDGSADLEERYVGFDNNDVEKFVANLKKLVKANNITAISKLVSYPITISGSNTKIVANDADEFIAKDSEIITPDFISSITNSYTKFMFTNWRGVMFGDGTYGFWIDQNSNTGAIEIYTMDIQ